MKSRPAVRGRRLFRIKRASSPNSRPWPCGGGFLLVALNLGLFLFRLPDIVEAVEHAMLAVGIDLEMNDTAVRTTD